MTEADLTLDIDQFRQFHHLLQTAFPAREALTHLLKLGLAINLETVSPPGDNLRTACLNIMEDLQSQGRLRDLLQAMLDACPDHPALVEFAAQFHIMPQPDAPLVGAIPQTVSVGISPDILSTARVDFASAEVTYRQQVIAAYQYLSFSGLDADTVLTDLPLEDLFVQLQLTTEPDTDDTESDQPAELRPLPKEVRKPNPVALSTVLQNHALIVGEPGAGKSTLLHWLAITFARDTQTLTARLELGSPPDWVPLLIKLSSLAHHYISTERPLPFLQTLLPDHLIRTHPQFAQVPAAFIQAALTAGRCLLLFDGLDEVVHPLGRVQLVQALADLIRTTSGNRVVVGTRPGGLRGHASTLSALRRYEIARFTPAEVRRFFEVWYARDIHLSPAMQQQEAAALYAQVMQYPRILQLAQTPLLSTILAVLWHRRHRLPDRRLDLYTQCCEVLVEQWEVHHTVDIPSWPEALRHVGPHLRLLEPLAYTIHNQEQTTSATRKQILPVLVQTLQTDGWVANEATAQLVAESWLEHLSLRSGLLQYQGHDHRGEAQYGFPHLTFQEYLTARYLARRPLAECRMVLLQHLHESWWREVYLLTIGTLGSEAATAQAANDLIDDLLHMAAAPAPWMRYPLVRDAELSTLEIGCACLVVLPLLLLFTQQVVVTLLAALILGILLIVRAPFQHFFLQMLIHSPARLRWILAREYEFAVRAVAECDANLLSSQVVTQLENLSLKLWRETLYDPLRRSDSHSPILAVRPLLPDAIQAKIYTILQTARNHRDEGLRTMVTQILDPGIRDGILRAHPLGSTGTTHKPNRHWMIPHSTKLSSLPDPAALAQSLSPPDPPDPATLIAALDNPNSIVRQNAARQLGRTAATNPLIRAALIKALTDPVSAVRRTAGQSLGSAVSTDPTSRRALITALKDSEAIVRIAATQSLGPIVGTDPDIDRALLTALTDPDTDVRIKVVEYLWTLADTDPAIQDSLLTVLKTDTQAVRQVVARVLGRGAITSPQIREGLLAALADPDVVVRRTAARSLAATARNDSTVRHNLIMALEDRNGIVRRSVVQSLGPVVDTDPESRAALIQALQDSDTRVRWAAIHHLRPLAETHAEVRAALHDFDILGERATLSLADSRVSQATAAHLEETREMLIANLTDPDEAKRIRAAEKIESFIMRDMGSRAALITTLTDPSSAVRRAAAGSLRQAARIDIDSRMALLAALEDSDIGVRTIITEGLGPLAIQDLAIRKALLAMLEDTNSEVRRAAIQSLEALVNTDLTTRTRLSAALHDNNPQVQNAAVKSLGSYAAADSAGRALLLSAIHKGEVETRIFAAQSLGPIVANDVESRTALIAALTDPHSGVRKMAAQILGQAAAYDRVSRTALLNTLADTDSPGRRAAAIGLGNLELKDEHELREIVDILHRGLYDPVIREPSLIALRRLLEGRRIPYS